ANTLLDFVPDSDLNSDSDSECDCDECIALQIKLQIDQEEQQSEEDILKHQGVDGKYGTCTTECCINVIFSTFTAIKTIQLNKSSDTNQSGLCQFQTDQSDTGPS